MVSGTLEDGDVRRRFESQRGHRWTATRRTAAQRADLLRGLRAEVLRRADAIADALDHDLGKPQEHPLHREVAAVLAAVDDATANLADWMRPSRRPSTRFPDAETEVRHEPRGTVLVLGPWNFPFQLLFEPLVPAIAAGNTTVLKPNELAPAVSRVAAEIVERAFDPADVTLVEGGVEVAEELLELPFDHIFFTGSPRVGARVMRAAAEHLASVTLELGGKSPCIVDGTADLETAAAQLAEGRQLNAGQVCIAPDYALVQADVLDAFVGHYLAAVRQRHHVDDRFVPATMSRIVDARNTERVRALCREAIALGARAVGAAGPLDRYDDLEPVVLLDVPPSARVLHEEIFGPVLPVLSFTEASEAIEHIRAGTKPLAMYVYSGDASFVESVVDGTSAGGVTVNGWASHYRDPALPFGGVNHSGHGSYHGVHGFRELSHAKSIVRHPRAGRPSPAVGGDHR